jgi:phage FluMu protein Com
MKKYTIQQQIALAMAGKVLRVFLNEEYLKCDCPVCKKLRKLHQKSEPYLKMFESEMKKGAQPT